MRALGYICYGLLVFVLFLSWFILYKACSILPYEDVSTSAISVINPLSSSNSELLYGLSKGINIRRKNFKKLNSQNKHITLVLIVGVEGVGHHLWEDVFESLSTSESSIVIDKYHPVKKTTASTKLQPCLLQCFSTTIWYETATTGSLQKSLSWNCPNCHKHINNSCNCVLMEIQKYSQLLPDGGILFLKHAFSYSFWDLNIRNHPDLNILIDYFQGDTYHNMENIFDIRLIVMRRAYINSIVSSCVNRFNKCMKRIQFLSKMLSVLQSQLMSIDTQFWIMLDYDDLIKQKEKYVDIISDWLGIDKELMKKAMKDAIKIKKKKEGIHLHKGVERSGWDKLRYDVQNVEDKYAFKAARRIFYSEGKYQWPLFNSSYFLVTPKNRQFLYSKYHVMRK